MASANKIVKQTATHSFPALVRKDSRVLILGSFPSVKSREQSFFYGHPQNRFWPLLALCFGEITPKTIEEKTIFCEKHHIALYDSIEQCDIHGSSDATIENVVPADLESIMEGTEIQTILINGKTAARYFETLQPTEVLSMPWFCLPSTSPANAAWSLEKLAQEWKKHLNFK